MKLEERPPDDSRSRFPCEAEAPQQLSLAVIAIHGGDRRCTAIQLVLKSRCMMGHEAGVGGLVGVAGAGRCRSRSPSLAVEVIDHALLVDERQPLPHVLRLGSGRSR